MVNLTINDKTLKVAEGTNVLEAAKTAGIKIPTMCHDADLTPYGACRLCLVEVQRNGRKMITTSCNCPVEEGMQIRTDTPEVAQNRKVMADLMLSRCPEVPAVKRMANVFGPLFPRQAGLRCGVALAMDVFQFQRDAELLRQRAGDLDGLIKAALLQPLC